jgi:mannose-6-phosphate isomerase-like protein (cupin superfamily)
MHVTDLNLASSDDIDWAGDPRFPGVLFKTLISGATGSVMSAAIAQVAPGGVIPTHQHPTETEMFHVISGDGIFQQGDQHVPIHAGFTGSVPPGNLHRVENTSQSPLFILAVHTPPTR